MGFFVSSHVLLRLSVFIYSRFPVFLLAIFLIALTLYLKHHNNRNEYIKMGLPSVRLRFSDLLGHLKSIPTGPSYNRLHPANVYFLQTLSSFAKLFQKQKMFTFWITFKPFIVLVKAEAVEELLSSTSMIEKAWAYYLIHPWLGSGLLTSKGAKWKSRRKLLTPSFHFDILKDFHPVVNEQCQVLVDILKKGTHKEWIDIVRPVTLCTLDIICETTLGVQIGAQKNSNSEYVQAVSRATTTIMDRLTNPLFWFDPLFYLSSTGRQFKRDLAVLHNFTRSVIKKKKSVWFPAQSDSVSSTISRRKALMDLLLDHHMDHGDLSEEDIREEVDTFAFAGHDTTAMGVSWALYLIGLYPEVQKKLQDELDNLFHGSDCEITTEDLKEMKYLECVIKEGQRLYPSVPFFARQATKEATIGGCKVPEGSVCSILSYMLHRDPDVFPNPEVFDPDRFLPEVSAGRHPYAFVPFSAGPRNCIGQRFAMMEMKTLIASVLRHFRLQSLEPRDKVVASCDVILRSPGPIKIKITSRETTLKHKN